MTIKQTTQRNLPMATRTKRETTRNPDRRTRTRKGERIMSFRMVLVLVSVLMAVGCGNSSSNDQAASKLKDALADYDAKMVAYQTAVDVMREYHEQLPDLLLSQAEYETALEALEARFPEADSNADNATTELILARDSVESTILARLLELPEWQTKSEQARKLAEKHAEPTGYIKDDRNTLIELMHQSHLFPNMATAKQLEWIQPYLADDVDSEDSSYISLMSPSVSPDDLWIEHITDMADTLSYSINEQTLPSNDLVASLNEDRDFSNGDFIICTAQAAEARRIDDVELNATRDSANKHDNLTWCRHQTYREMLICVHSDYRNYDAGIGSTLRECLDDLQRLPTQFIEKFVNEFSR